MTHPRCQKPSLCHFLNATNLINLSMKYRVLTNCASWCMENTCSHSEGGLAESFLFLSMLDHGITTQSIIVSYTACDQHMQEILSVEQRVFICSTFVKCVP